MTLRLLAIFDDCGPGDAVAAAFALDALRAANPRAEIVVVAGEHAYEVFRGTKVADRVVRSRLYVSRPRGAMRARLEKVRDAVSLVKELGFGYDLAVTFFWGTLALNLIAFLLARRRVGYVNRLRFLQSVEMGAYQPLDDGVAQNQALLAASGASPLPASLVTATWRACASWTRTTAGSRAGGICGRGWRSRVSSPGFTSSSSFCIRCRH